MIFALTVLYAVLATTVFAAPLDVSLTRVVGGGGTSTTLGNAISVLSSGGIVVSGYTNGNVAGTLVGVTEGFVRSFGPDGTVFWTNQESTGAGNTLLFTSNAIDSSDNVFVVGRCTGSFYGDANAGGDDVCGIMYDSTGVKLASFVTGGTANDQAWKVAINKADSTIYIVGSTVSTTWNGQTKTGASDAFLLKYSISGSTSTLLGTYLFGVAGQNTLFFAVTVDSAGNIWAVGYTTGATYRGSSNAGAAGVQDFLIQKTSPSGTVLFSTLIGGPGLDLAYGVTTDASNSAYICGYTTSTFDGIPLVGGGRDLVVVKYNSAGVKQWSKTFGGSADEGATGVSFDTINNVLLVNGYTQSASVFGIPSPYPATQFPFLLVLDPSTGNMLSARLYTGPTSAAISATGVANNAAAVYMTGTNYGAFQGQAVSGAASAYMLKVERYASAPYDVSYLALGGSSSNGYDVAMFSNGDAVLGASSADSAGITQLMVQRYSSSGNVLWTAQAGGTGSEGLSRVAVDSSGNTYAVGGSNSPYKGIAASQTDAAFAKFNSTGGTVFYAQFGGSGDDGAAAVAVDSTASFFYAVGSTTSPTLNGVTRIGSWDGYVTKINAATGALVAGGHHQFGCASCITLFNAVTFDSLGMLWFVGSNNGPAYYGFNQIGGQDMFLQKFNPSTGVSVVVDLVGGTGDEDASAITIDADNSMYATAVTPSAIVNGEFAPGGAANILVVKWNSAGVKQWTRLFGDLGGDEAYASAVDSNRGLLYLTGQTDSATFYGSTNTNGVVSPMLLVLNTATGDVVYSAIYIATGGSFGRGVATNGVSTYIGGTAVSNLLGMNVNQFQGTSLLRLVGNVPGPTAGPTRAPTGPSYAPTASPTGPYEVSVIGNTNPYNAPSGVYGGGFFSNGDIVMAGITTGYLESPASNNNYYQFLLQRFTPSGTLLWSAEAGGTNNEFLAGAAVDVNNYVYTTGSSYSAFKGVPAAGSDIVYAKFTGSAGDTVFYRQYGGTGDDSAAAVSVDSTGSFFYLVGKTNSPSLNGTARTGVVDGFVTKINTATGVIARHRQFGCAGCTVSISASALDVAGNLWVTGTVQGGPYYSSASLGGTDMFIQKFDAVSGNSVFVSRVGGTGADSGKSITIDTSGNIYAAGTSNSASVDGLAAPGAGNNILVVKWNSAGVKQGTQLIGGDGDDSVTGIAVDSSSSQLYLTGNSNSTSLVPLSKQDHKIPVGVYIALTINFGNTIVAYSAIAIQDYLGIEEDIHPFAISTTFLVISGTTSLMAGLGILYAASESSPDVRSSHFLGIALNPIVFPTYQPTLSPTLLPSRTPTRQPSRLPTSQPSRQPSSQPSRQPSRQPTTQPSRQPSRQPTSQPSASPTTLCGAGWAHYGNKCYKTNLPVMTFNACRAYCPSQHAGAGMLCIENADQNAFVASHVTANSWMGYTNELTNGTYYWGSGCFSKYTNWGVDQPDNFNNRQHWAVIHSSTASPGGVWDDIAGSYSCNCEYALSTTCATGARRLEEEEDVVEQALQVAPPAAPTVTTRTPKLRGYSLIKSLLGV